MSCGGLGGSTPPSAADRLRAAFGNHAIATGWRWSVSINTPAPNASAPPGRRPAAARIDLTAEDAGALAELLLDAVGHADSQTSGDWIGTARVAKMLDVTQGTIRGWVTRNGPKDNPFPQPDHTDSGRNFWHKRTVSKWRARRRQLDRSRRRGR